MPRKHFEWTTGRIILTGFIVTILAWGLEAIIYFSFFNIDTTPAATDQISLIAPALFFTETEKKIDVTTRNGTDVVNIIANERAKLSVRVGAMERIILTNKVGEIENAVPSGAFLSAIGPHLPPSLARTLEDSFMLGLYAFEAAEPFVVLKITSYEQAFAAMLAWEGGMPSDLKILLSPSKQVVVSSTTPLGIGGFTDVVVKNKDVRVFKDTVGQVLFLYSFIDRNTLVITTNEGALSEIVRRLSTPRVVR